jgi:IS30 family transposase
MAGMGLPQCCIAVILGKHLSSVYRELAWNSEQGLYTGAEAHRQAEQRRLESKGHPKVDHAPVKDWFKKDCSPDQIAGRLKVEYPQEAKMRVSPERIYGYLYGEIKEEPELKGPFRHPRAYRKARGGNKALRGQIPDRKLIDTRPTIVDKKIRAGGRDTVEGAGKTASIATFVDKPTKVLKGNVMPNKAVATLNKAARGVFRSIPDDYIKTVTVDTGKAFSGHKGLSQKLRGAIEGLTQRQLDRIVEKINNPPP